MPRYNPLDYLVRGDWLDTFLPDFALAFAFFTALIYMVLGRRFGHQRAAIVVSAAMGAALSAGLVWWEQANGMSIRNLGPVAVGFAVIVLGGVMYQSIRGIGGGWAGAGIAFGACILVGWTLGIDWPVASEIVQTLAGAALTVGILAFLLHRRGIGGQFPRAPAEVAEMRHDMSDLYEDRNVSDRITDGLRRVRNQAATLWQRADRASDVMLQLRRILPAEGWLTQRMSRLPARAHFLQKGHVARIKELQDSVGKLPARTKVKVSRELQTRCRELKIDQRVERLDRLVASNERTVRDLTRQAQTCLAAQEHEKLAEVLEAAQKVQQRCTKLFKLIERTERKLIIAAKTAARRSREVSHA